MQDDDSLLRSFVAITPAAEKILSDGTDVDGTAKYRHARTESLEYLSELSFYSFRVITLFEKLPNFIDVGGGICTDLSLEIQFKHTFISSIL
jgi:hypothetical protein